MFCDRISPAASARLTPIISAGVSARYPYSAAVNSSADGRPGPAGSSPCPTSAPIQSSTIWAASARSSASDRTSRSSASRSSTCDPDRNAAAGGRSWVETVTSELRRHHCGASGSLDQPRSNQSIWVPSAPRAASASRSHGSTVPRSSPMTTEPAADAAAASAPSVPCTS